MMYKSKLLNQAMSINNDSLNVSTLMMEPDTEPLIEINADLRSITIPDELKDIAVAGDHLCETIFFTCPRYFDGNDLSEHTCIIRFINAGNEYGECNVVDLTPDDSSIKFGWELDNHVTRYSGKIQFTVQFETKDNGIKYQWQTTPAELNILSGLNIEATITDKDDILFRSLVQRITILEENVESLIDSIEKTQTLYDQLSQLQSDVKYLKENVVYTLSEL